MKVSHFPLYQLRIRTPRLELRLPDLDELDALAGLAAEGVHDPDRMPFLVPWTDLPPAERARGVIQRHWRLLGAWTPEEWSLNLTVFADGRPVGLQMIGARDFKVLRQVNTGSWLGLRHHGKGIGTEMRAAVLHLAFAELGAEEATSASLMDNHASLAVSRKLGYRENGTVRVRVRDEAKRDQNLTLDRDRWQWHRTVPVEVDGLDACRAEFGA